jgi:hypothetical protein
LVSLFGLDETVEIFYPLAGVIFVFDQIRQEHKLINGGAFQVRTDFPGNIGELIFLCQKSRPLLLIEQGNVDPK